MMKCDCCEDREAKYRVNITDMHGVVIEIIEVCPECIVDYSINFAPPLPKPATQVLDVTRKD